MNGSSLIDTLQLLSGALWLSVLASRTPSVFRCVSHREPGIVDFFGLLLAGIAAVQMGFVLRWWLYPATKRIMDPGELSLWGCLYVTSTLIALASHWLPRRG